MEKTCRSCGAVAQDALDRFCTACGAELPVPAPMPCLSIALPPETPPSPKKKDGDDR